MKSFIYICMLFFLASCYEPIGEEETNNKEKTEGICQLQISVFSSNISTPYPVNLLVFDSKGNRIKDCTLTADKPTISEEFAWGSFRIVALSGTSYYELPTNFTLESPISFSTLSLPQEPLLMGEMDITLSSEQARAYLQMIPQTAEISFKGTNLSSLTKQVKVQLSSLYSKVNMQGCFEEPKTYTFSCEKKNNTWSILSCHLFPAHGTNTIVSMEVIRTDSTLNYGYILPYPIKTGYRYEILASPSGLLVNDVLIDPNLAAETSKVDTIILSKMPSVPSIWDGHIIVYQEKTEENEADLWLMSINEWENVHSANAFDYSTEATNIASTYQEGGTLSGRIIHWHIPTKEEAYALRSLYAGDRITNLNNILSANYLPTWSLIDGSGDNLRFLCNEALHTFSLATNATSITKGGTKATYHLRLLKKIHVQIKDKF